MTARAVGLLRARIAPAGSTQGAAVDGAALLSAATMLAGLLIYAFHVLAARSLGPSAYGRIAVLWGATFIAAVVLFRPLEQTSARAVADRIARGEEVRSVLRAVSTVCAGCVLVALTGIAAAWGPITDGLFDGRGLLTGMLMAGVAIYGATHLVRGLAGGLRWFNGYGLLLLVDAVARLAIAAPLVLVASTGVAAAAVVLAGLAAAVVTLAVGRTRLRAALARGGGARFPTAAALAFAGPASVVAAADQLLINGSPLLVVGGGGTAAAAGVVFAATMMVRVPAFLFQGLATSLLPNLTTLQVAEGSHGGLRRAVLRTGAVLLAAGGLLVAGAAAIGPEGLRLLYGEDFEAGRRDLVVLAAGAAVYLVAATISQALLAFDRAGRAATGWALAAGVFVAAYAVLPGSALARIAAAFALASLTAACTLAGLLLRRDGSRPERRSSLVG